VITSRTPTAKKIWRQSVQGVLLAIYAIYTPFVLPLAYRRDRWPDFDAQYAKRRGSAQGSAFWGLENLNVILKLFIRKIPKNAMAPMGKM